MLESGKTLKKSGNVSPKNAIEHNLTEAQNEVWENDAKSQGGYTINQRYNTNIIAIVDWHRHLRPKLNIHQ